MIIIVMLTVLMVLTVLTISGAQSYMDTYRTTHGVSGPVSSDTFLQAIQAKVAAMGVVCGTSLTAWPRPL